MLALSPSPSTNCASEALSRQVQTTSMSLSNLRQARSSSGTSLSGSNFDVRDQFVSNAPSGGTVPSSSSFFHSGQQPTFSLANSVHTTASGGTVPSSSSFFHSGQQPTFSLANSVHTTGAGTAPPPFESTQTPPQLVTVNPLLHSLQKQFVLFLDFL
ncbi:hypothetical protein Tcan_10295 [Toxocara canis]|uniref:Uncharacterized protein n=1 Tax=Toxocara canis TaxID=6265 RepID=A0A0B2W5B9_TOXCA|nr:hypothetical protein Tcan_10295 [Toxocara canis]